MAESCHGPSSTPAATAGSPAVASSPARRTFAPAAGATVISTVAGGALSAAAPPSPSAVCSSGTTASAPLGMGAPVMMRTASPGPIGGSSEEPAATSATTRSRAPAGADAACTV